MLHNYVLKLAAYYYWGLLRSALICWTDCLTQVSWCARVRLSFTPSNVLLICNSSVKDPTLLGVSAGRPGFSLSVRNVLRSTVETELRTSNFKTESNSVASPSWKKEESCIPAFQWPFQLRPAGIKAVFLA